MARQTIPCKRCGLLLSQHNPENKITHEYTPYSAIDLILRERCRQKTEEGVTDRLDDNYQQDQLALAAAHYADPFSTTPFPWSRKWSKQAKEHTRLRQLVIAGALIAAEIDRQMRSGVTE